MLKDCIVDFDQGTLRDPDTNELVNGKFSYKGYMVLFVDEEIWRRKHGEISEDKTLIHINGDEDDCRIQNLQLKDRYDYQNGEVRKPQCDLLVHGSSKDGKIKLCIYDKKINKGIDLQIDNNEQISDLYQQLNDKGWSADYYRHSCDCCHENYGQYMIDQDIAKQFIDKQFDYYKDCRAFNKVVVSDNISKQMQQFNKIDQLAHSKNCNIQ